MKLFVTREYFSDAENRIRELNVTLDKIRADKTAAYRDSGKYGLRLRSIPS